MSDGNFNFESITLLPTLVCVKDIKSRFLSISQPLAKGVGWKNPEEAIGKANADMPCPMANFAKVFEKLDQKVIQQKARMVALDFQEYAAGWKIIIAEKIPVLDNNGNVVATYHNLTDTTHLSAFKGMLNLANFDKKLDDHKLKPRTYILNDTFCPLPLTEKQAVCMFYLIRGKSYKEISVILNLSLRTIESHIEAIKNRMRCTSKSELIEKAIDSGFIFYIPPMLH